MQTADEPKPLIEIYKYKHGRTSKASCSRERVPASFIMGRFTHLLLATLGLMAAPAVLADCNYQASNVVTGTNSLTADLKLTGSCSQYPDDHQGALVDLKLLVEYQTSEHSLPILHPKDFRN